jgi:hypothetical protein
MGRSKTLPVCALAADDAAAGDDCGQVVVLLRT